MPPVGQTAISDSIKGAFKPPASENPKVYLTMAQICAHPHIRRTKCTIYRWLEEGSFPGPTRYVGQSPLWDADVIELWVLDSVARQARERRLAAKSWSPSFVKMLEDGSVVPLQEHE